MFSVTAYTNLFISLFFLGFVFFLFRLVKAILRGSKYS